jgi:transcriptional regulator with XRE-family HTH domain
MSDKPSTIEVSLSELIQIHRDRLHMSQLDLAMAAGVSRNYISLIECGNTESVSLGVMRNICRALGLKLQIGFDNGGVAVEHGHAADSIPEGFEDEYFDSLLDSDRACACGIDKLREWTVDSEGKCVECHPPRR